MCPFQVLLVMTGVSIAHCHGLTIMSWHSLATGLSAGDSQRYGNFRLGGSFGDSGYFTLPDEWRSLRGYFPATDSGANYYLSAIEYRLPLVWIDRGYKALPVFVRNISAAAFIDAGAAYDTTEELGAPPLVGAGAELRSSLLVSWGGGISVRGGYAFGLTEGGIPLGSVDGFTVGSAEALG